MRLRYFYLLHEPFIKSDDELQAQKLFTQAKFLTELQGTLAEHPSPYKLDVSDLNKVKIKKKRKIVEKFFIYDNIFLSRTESCYYTSKYCLYNLNRLENNHIPKNLYNWHLCSINPLRSKILEFTKEEQTNYFYK